MSIFGEKSLPRAFLLLIGQRHALSDEDAHPPLFQMSIFDDNFANEYLPFGSNPLRGVSEVGSRGAFLPHESQAPVLHAGVP